MRSRLSRKPQINRHSAATFDVRTLTTFMTMFFSAFTRQRFYRQWSLALLVALCSLAASLSVQAQTVGIGTKLSPMASTTPTPGPCTITLNTDEVKWNAVRVYWSQCQDEDFESYVLYRSTTQNFTPDATSEIDCGSLEQAVEQTAYADSGLTAETTYYYALRTTHGGQTTEARTSVKTAEPDVPVMEFTGLARSCAGGIAVDGVHDFTLEGTAKLADGTIVANTPFAFSFSGNKGHNYEDNTPLKKAKYVTVDGQNQTQLVETQTLTTDANGKVSVHVLSSDIITRDIKIKVQWTDAQSEQKDAGTKACDFGEAVGKRRFPNQQEPAEIYPEDDNGWLFGQRWLSAQNAETTAKVYLKFMIDPNVGDVDGNWKIVNGHRIIFSIEKVDPIDDVEIAESQSDYATAIPNESDGTTVHSTTVDGAATAIIRAGAKIDEARTVWLAAENLTQRED